MHRSELPAVLIALHHRAHFLEGAPGSTGEATAVAFLKQQVLEKHGKALAIYGYSHFWRGEPPRMLGLDGGAETGIVRMLEKDFPGRTVAVIPVGNPPTRYPSQNAKADYRKFDRALKTPLRPVLISLQRSPFRDFSAEEFGGDVVVCRGTDHAPKESKGKIPSAPVRVSGPCVSVFQGSSVTLGQLADAAVYFGGEGGSAPKAKSAR